MPRVHSQGGRSNPPAEWISIHGESPIHCNAKTIPALRKKSLLDLFSAGIHNVFLNRPSIQLRAPRYFLVGLKPLVKKIAILT